MGQTHGGQVDGQTPDHFFTLFVMDAASVIMHLQ